MQSEEARWSQKHTLHGGDADEYRYGAAGGTARAYCSPENSKLNLLVAVPCVTLWSLW